MRKLINWCFNPNSGLLGGAVTAFLSIGLPIMIMYMCGADLELIDQYSFAAVCFWIGWSVSYMINGDE